MWFAVRNEDADFFSCRVYDPFVLVPYYIGMYYGEDVKICGKVSRKLYRNLTLYAQRILRDFSDHMRPVRLEVEGFDRVEEGADLVGTGISCGVDSLSTIYDRCVLESDPEYRVNALFIFNCGTHGDYEDPNTRKVFLQRYEMNRRAADELGLPVHLVDSNLHAFTHRIGENRVGFFAIYSCIFSLQRRIRRYYTPSGLAYREILETNEHYRDYDMDGYCGSFMVPLIQTEGLELIYEGGQYLRSEKTAKIADWDVARRYLNVCVNPLAKDSRNCGYCGKCVRTLVALDALDKLESFAGVFDLEKYRKNRFHWICCQLRDCHTENYCRDNVDLLRKNGRKLPPVWVARLYLRAEDAGWACRRFVRRVKRKLRRMLAR